MTTLTRRITLAVATLLIGGHALAFDLQGHRGARGLAPENTLAAFAAALGLGVSTLELDVNLSQDGAVVIHHDLALNPALTRNGNGRYLPDQSQLISRLTLSQLQSYDVGRLQSGSDYAKNFPEQKAQDGERIPTLASLFALAAERRADGVRFNIETKLSPVKPEYSADMAALTRALIAEIRKAGVANRATIQSFDWRSLQLVQKEAPEIATVYLSSANTLQVGKWGASPWLAGFDVDDYDGSAAKLVKAAGGRIWSPDYRSLTAEQVKAAQSLGLQVIPWTVNDEADLRRLLDWQVDGLITDYPDRARKLMSERGMALPKAYP